MAQFIKIKDLAARKQALLSESEVYRQTLKLELQNLQSCGQRFRRKFGLFNLSKQAVFLLPLLSSIWAWRRSAHRVAEPRPRSKLDLVLAGRRLCCSFAPMLGGLMGRRLFRR